jgi:TfoX/Sxy family transcriptional regulator of competence genes
VAYDEELADRVRRLITERHDVAEQKMFGGLAFLIGGHMAVVVSGEGGLLARVDPAESEQLVATTNAESMVMRGRPMRGWLRVATSDVRTEQTLLEWVQRSVGYAVSLPPKDRRRT